MIIHSPKITGSLSFPREDGTEVVLQISTGGELETIELDSNGSQTSIKPASNLSGSFTGSFRGDGSNLTGVAATSLNIDGFTAGTLAGEDEILFSDTSDSGNEKRATLVSGIDAIGLFSGSSQLTSSLDLRYLEIGGDSVVSGSQQVLDLVSIDEDNFSSDSATKLPTQQSVKAYVDSQVETKDALSELSGDTDDVSEGSSNLYYTDARVKTKLDADGVISGSSQVNANTISNFDSNVDARLNTKTVISGSSQVDYDNIQNQPTTISSAQATKLSNITITQAVDLDTLESNVSTNNSKTGYTDSLVKTKLDTDSVVSGSASQVRSFLNVESGATADQTGAEIKTALFNESDTNNLTDTLLSKLNNIESSADITDSGNVTPILNSVGVISGSEQVNANSVTNFDSNVDARMDTKTVISGSSQVNANSITNFDSNVKAKLDAETVISGSSQVNANSITNFDSNVKAKLDADGVISGSSQITITESQISDLSHYGDSDVKIKLNADSVVSGSASQVRSFLNVASGATNYGDSDVIIVLNDNAVVSGSNSQVKTFLSIAASDISDVDAFSQSGNYSGLRAQATTAGDVGLGNVTNESKSTMFTSPTFTGTVSGVTATHVGLGNVTNESKSTMFSSPAFTGNPTATTQTSTNDSTRLATTAFVQTRVSELIGNAGSTLDTLGELSASLADDSGSLATLTTTVGTKLAKSSNLSDLADAGTARSNLGLGSVENTALSTYTGNGGALDNQYIANGAGYITSFTNTNQLTTFQVEDGDGTEVTISHGKEWKFVEGTGIDINWTDTSNGTDGDPYDLTITNTAPFTGDVFDNDGTFASLRAQGTTKGDVGLGNVENTALSTYTGNGGALDNQYIANGAGYTTNTGTVTSVTVGSGLDIEDGTTTPSITLDLSEFTETTGFSSAVGDYFIVLDGNAERKTTAGNINLSIFNNDSGFISDITTQTDSKYLRSNANDTATGIISITNSTASTSKTTGALVVTGGVGISGALNVGGDVVAFASSDERLKDNIELISNPIEKVQSLKGVTWDWNENADELQQSLPNVGVIAQDVEKILPQLVTDRDNGFKGVDYAKLTGLLIEAIKEQQKQIDDLKSKLG